ncbi:hypothetical protein [Paraliomyxa miuraensis]|uniref:hypothetical protein n=1 Tax=Paraliomyxa miuraensis TaxID=376150 RepID=UPI00224FEFD5|nr:hypothetical protein [Paraliomyxa miuraensis]MCX4242465.1 hypothetical protein [Paraliomyxa miuraensis]
MQARALVSAVSVAWALAGCGEPGTSAEADDGGSTMAAMASSSSGVADDSDGPPSQPGIPMPLVRAEAWDLDDAADDPFADHRPDWVQCELGWGVETGIFEVSTDLCTYGAFVQSSLARIHEGDELELVILYDALWFEEEATAHVAVALGEEIAWETELPIPSAAGQLRPRWTAPADVEVGTPVHFHLHNHGLNNYRLIGFTVTTP